MLCNLILHLCLLIVQCLAVWPAPLQFEKGESVLWLAQDFYVSYMDGNVCQNVNACSFSVHELTLQDTSHLSSVPLATPAGSRVVRNAVARARDALFTHNIIPWKRLPRNTIASYEPDASENKTYIT